MQQASRSGLGARQRTIEAARGNLKAVSRRFRDAEEGVGQPGNRALEAVVLLLDVVEGCLAYCWQTGSLSSIARVRCTSHIRDEVIWYNARFSRRMSIPAPSC